MDAVAQIGEWKSIKPEELDVGESNHAIRNRN
jgi:hypothetical protein